MARSVSRRSLIFPRVLVCTVCLKNNALRRVSHQRLEARTLAELVPVCTTYNELTRSYATVFTQSKPLCPRHRLQRTEKCRVMHLNHASAQIVLAQCLGHCLGRDLS